jgi:DNA-binding beta-propeller fold protein YncE
MNRKQDFKKWRPFMLSLLFLATLFCFTHCKEEYDPFAKKEVVPFDPSKPVEFTTFYPDSGGVRTQVIVKGSNFGTDVSLIKAFVNDKPAPVIGSTGTEMLILVPSRADTGYVKIQISNGDQMKELVSENEFNYIFRPSVSTLAGFVDKDGKTAIVDGTFPDVAQFEEPYWLSFDQNKNLYVIEEARAVRFIDLENSEVSTKFRTGGSFTRPRTIAFSLSYDTMYVASDADNAQWNSIAGLMLTASTNFTIWTTVIQSLQCNGVAVHPKTGEIFYNSYNMGQVYKWDPITRTSKELFRIGEVQQEFLLQFAPSGDFAYMVVKNRNYILKSNYNWTTGELEPALPFAGSMTPHESQGGFQDGTGTTVRFNSPQQGAFDEDNNFYICDGLNHCIRKITPNAIVTLFAGRPGNYGYADGTLLDSQFDRPYGIAYDIESATFYVADQKNRRIRAIKNE